MLAASRLELFSGRSQFRSGQHQEVIGNDRTPDVPAESLPTFPGAAVKPEGSLEGGYPGFDTGPEVAQRALYTQALLAMSSTDRPRFLANTTSLTFVLFGKGKVVL